MESDDKKHNDDFFSTADDKNSQSVDEVNEVKGHDEWAVDEDYLKENEKELTDEEKQNRKDAADRLKMDGNELYQATKYEEAATSYTLALNTCPITFTKERTVYYANRAACFLYMKKYSEGISDCNKSLELNPTYFKVLQRRALLYENADKLDEALEDYKKILEMDPKNSTALEACMRLPPLINERNEKLKTEMLGKLKDLGNIILRPFGLSTSNFNLQKDPNSGSYSVNFQQNK
ncbi:hypothetical protein CHUAL_008054 [Chamberlinius hualienensis]